MHNSTHWQSIHSNRITICVMDRTIHLPANCFYFYFSFQSNENQQKMKILTTRLLFTSDRWKKFPSQCEYVLVLAGIWQNIADGDTSQHCSYCINDKLSSISMQSYSMWLNRKLPKCYFPTCIDFHFFEAYSSTLSTSKMNSWKISMNSSNCKFSNDQNGE